MTPDVGQVPELPGGGERVQYPGAKEISGEGWCRFYCAPLSLRRLTELKQGSLCLCRCFSPPTEAQVASLLTEEERGYYWRVGSEARRRSFLLGRFAAKKALSLFSGERPQRIRIRYGAFNNPLVSDLDTEGERLELSISHSAELGAALVFPCCQQMGIDIEKVNADRSKVIESEMTSGELATFRRSSALDRDSMLTAAWTMKESIAKALKTGLMTPLSILEISEITQRSGAMESSFSNFHQYKANSFRIGDHFLSVALPKRTELAIDVEAVAAKLFGERDWQSR